jgi:hypothetical protein
MHFSKIGPLFLILASSAGFGQVSSHEALKPLTVDTSPASPASYSYKEDWSAISLAGSNLIPAPVQFGERDDEAEYTRELWRVQWRPDDPIDLYVILPKGVKNPPLILYLYSYPAEEDRFRDDDFCKLVVKNGFAAIGFVSALTGQRYHGRPMREWFVSNLQESLAMSVHDVQMILNYLASRGDLDMNRVGMFGDGSGGSIAILAGAADKRIKALDLLEPWGDWPQWLAESPVVPQQERADYTTPQFLSRLLPLDPTKWLPQLDGRAVRLQIISNEAVTPKSAKERLQAAMPPTGEIVRYENNKNLVESAASGKFFDWLKEQVGSAASHSSNRVAVEEKLLHRDQ